MSGKYTVQHVGYPVAGRPIRDDEWKNYSKHASLKAAYRAIDKATSHLDYGSWDDHYRVIAPDGSHPDRQAYLAELELDRIFKRR